MAELDGASCTATTHTRANHGLEFRALASLYGLVREDRRVENNPAPRSDEHRPYFRCPACDIIGEPDSTDFLLTRNRQDIDWARPVTVRCGSCRTSSRIARADILDRDTEHACSHCGHYTACPSDADRVICWDCGLNAPGPASTGARAVYRQDVEHSANQWAVAQVRVAKDDARHRGPLPGWAS